MVKLAFSLLPEACARIHDALVCMGKFSDSVALEARPDRLGLSALNLSKSGYASFVFDGSTFFDSYEYTPTKATVDGRFTCEISNKALSSVFKGRIIDVRNRETAIDRCDVVLQERADQAECRFIIKMICFQGVTKTYSLTYEAKAVMHAWFDRALVTSRWSIKSGYLREFVEYFGARTEQLDFYYDNEQITFTSFTEKIVNANREILKHPLQTAVTVNVADFEDFQVQPQVHVIINVKDFKAIVSHADTLRCQLKAEFSRPGKPLQFRYEGHGVECTFTLMTIHDGRSIPAPVPGLTRTVSTNTSRRPDPSEPVPSNNGRQSSLTEMPPPSSINTRKVLGRAKPVEPTAPKPAMQPTDKSDSLFIPPDEDDHRWDPTDYEEEDTLGWDASADNDNALHATFRDTSSTAPVQPGAPDANDGLQPTQRVSQIKGLW